MSNEYILKIENTTIHIKNILEYLKNEALLNVRCDNNQLIFQPTPKHKYFELIKIAELNRVESNVLKQIYSEYFPTEALNVGIDNKISEKLLANIKDLTKDNIKDDELTNLSLFIHTYRSILFWGGSLIPNLLEKALLPKFFKCFPKGEVYAIKIDTLLEKKFAIIRSLYWLQNKKFLPNKDNFTGFDSLKGFHTPSVLNMGDFFHPLFLLFSPFVFGFTSMTATAHLNPSRIPNAIYMFVFLTGNNIKWYPIFNYEIFKLHQIPYDKLKPRNLVKVLIPKNTPISFEHIYKSTFPATIPENRQTLTFNSSNYATLLQWWIEKLNNFFNYIADPTNFTENHEIKPDRQFLSGLTLDRIFKESTIIETEMRQNHPSFVSFQLSCAMLDQIANLITQGKIKGNDAETFKKLLNSNLIAPKLNKIFKTMPTPFNNYCRNQFKNTLEEILQNLKESIFFKGSWENNKLKILDEYLTLPEYFSELMRALRNTHHGYLLTPKNLECLKITTGENLLDLFPKLMKYYLIWLLVEIDNLSI